MCGNWKKNKNPFEYQRVCECQCVKINWHLYSFPLALTVNTLPMRDARAIHFILFLFLCVYVAVVLFFRNWNMLCLLIVYQNWAKCVRTNDAFYSLYICLIRLVCFTFVYISISLTLVHLPYVFEELLSSIARSFLFFSVHFFSKFRFHQTIALWIALKYMKNAWFTPQIQTNSEV